MEEKVTKRQVHGDSPFQEQSSTEYVCAEQMRGGNLKKCVAVWKYSSRNVLFLVSIL